jgi:Pyruvate/2-oxoacid:ferredoxin oxidoreductase delta subunit
MTILRGMPMSLKQLLDSKRCIKIICGAGNEDLEQVAYLTDIYARAGVRYFDVSANEDAVWVVRKVLKKLGIEGYICVSYGVKGDTHASKATISPKCVFCGECVMRCPQKAINVVIDSAFTMDEKKCIGCNACVSTCRYKALSLVNKPKSIEDTLPKLVLQGIDSVELHANGNIEDIVLQLNTIKRNFKGMISLCMDRSLYGDKQLMSIFSQFVSGKSPYTTIIQADGLPMGGNNNSPGTTLQALAIGQIVERAKLPTYLLLSGGTNGTTTYLARMMGLHYNGISVGSYARKIIEGLSDKEALRVAKDFVHDSLSYME